MSFLRRLFRRKKPAPLVCSVTLDDHGNPIGDDPSHVHTSACFVDFEPLALVELFQSQGCVSCLPAVPTIQKAVTEQPNRLLLTYNVTLFDHLGWKDTFASGGPAGAVGDQRQRAYVKKWGRNTLFTPQVVVNGLTDTSGARGADDINEAVNHARAGLRLPFHVYLDANDTEVRIDSDAPVPGASLPTAAPDTTTDAAPITAPVALPAPAPTLPLYNIMVATFRAGDQTVKIGKGPNKGKKLPHRNAIDTITKIGQWQGGDLTVALPVPKSSWGHGIEGVAFLQEGAGGPIIAAAKI
ncbi:hypothetical protein SBRCBS47491_002158 [Sporothrix bragantina]|uniref:Thioredoxin domain-containing protein n=1 Tax=Sporothrix bragantina TaxID=671064 RepID=A0ABP0B563_9PEZI